MRIVVTIVTLSLVFGAAAVLDPTRIRALVEAGVQGFPVAAYLALSLEPFIIAGLAVLAVRIRQWMIPVMIVAAVVAIATGSALEFGALLLAVAIVGWPPRWSRLHLRPA